MAIHQILLAEVLMGKRNEWPNYVLSNDREHVAASSFIHSKAFLNPYNRMGD
jgi:hypothetical protein